MDIEKFNKNEWKNGKSLIMELWDRVGWSNGRGWGQK